MITGQDTTPRHAADEVDGPTLPGIAVVLPNSGGRRYAVDPDDQQTQVLAPVDAGDTFFGGFEESASEHTAELEALAVEGTRVTGRLALAWFGIVASFGVIVEEIANTIRMSARWEESHALTIARVVFVTLSALVLAGAGIGWVLL